MISILMASIGIIYLFLIVPQIWFEKGYFIEDRRRKLVLIQADLDKALAELDYECQEDMEGFENRGY